MCAPGAPLGGAVPTSPLATAAPSGQPAAAAEVSVLDNHFAPRSISVKAGTSVAWRNKGINLHSVTALDQSWDSGTLLPGQEFTMTFTKPGTYHYFCRQHALNGQFGTVEVK